MRASTTLSISTTTTVPVYVSNKGESGRKKKEAKPASLFRTKNRGGGGGGIKPDWRKLNTFSKGDILNSFLQWRDPYLCGKTHGAITVAGRQIQAQDLSVLLGTGKES